MSSTAAELCELIICTGMLRGEALALHWADVNLNDRLLFVRYSVRVLRRRGERHQLLHLAAGPA